MVEVSIWQAITEVGSRENEIRGERERAKELEEALSSIDDEVFPTQSIH